MQLESKVVYGPVDSRRFGWDLGINLLPLNRKLCTFDCIYCQYGFTPPLKYDAAEFPNANKVIDEWTAAIKSCASQNLNITHTTISGNGEPTLHPKFAEVIRRIVEWRNQNARQLKLAILSDGYRIHSTSIRQALELIDDPIIKLDCGTSEKINKINRPLFQFQLRKFIEDLKKFRRVIIQTMLIKGWNDSPEDLECWRNILIEIQPAEVQIYTVTRSSPIQLTPLSESELRSIAELTSSATQIPVYAYL
jgi:wyosine [tRNA(Phe)-imidazoG37] synthetase (radical SAM superfamily)